MWRVSRHAHTKKMANVPKNTPYVTPSPTYLEVPSLLEPSTALLLTKIQIYRYTQFQA